MARSIYVMSVRSSSCPRIPSSLQESRAGHHLVIKTVEHAFHGGDDACSADMAVTTSIVRLPAGMDTGTLVVQVDGVTTNLSARSG